jgi:glutathione reductase (NADPH)
VAYGWEPVQPAFHWNRLQTAVDTEVRRLSRLHITLLEKAGVELLHGNARLLDEHTVAIDGQTVTAEKILIAVGGKPVRPDIPGIEHTLTSNEMFHLPIQPQRFAVVGGGFIAVEFAGILNGLGSQVTQIVRRDHILRGFDEDLRQAVQDGMAHHGIEFLTQTLVTKVEKLPEGVRLQLNSGRTLEADAVLFATGRQPWLEGLGLEAVGVDIKSGAIAVDEFSRTSVPNIFAVGDCTDRVNLTPVAIAEGRAFADSEFGKTPRSVNHATYASAVFGQPQAAAIGLTEAQARSRFGNDGVQIFQTRFRPMFYSLPKEEERTMMKLVVETATDRVVGVHMVGPDAAEIIQGVAIAVTKGCTKADFDATMALHPTAAEELVTMT